MSKPLRPATMQPVLPRRVTRRFTSLPAGEDLFKAAVKPIQAPEELADAPCPGRQEYADNLKEPGSNVLPSLLNRHPDTPGKGYAALRCSFQVRGYGRCSFVAGREAGDGEARPASLTLHPLLFFPL